MERRIEPGPLFPADRAAPSSHDGSWAVDDLVRVGSASAPSHNGEILRGVFRAGDGRTCPGLVTMPNDLHRVRAVYLPASIPVVVVRPPAQHHPPAQHSARRAAEATLSVLGWPATGGYVDLVTEVPAPHRRMSSTGDVLATIRAVLDAFSSRLPDELVARIAVYAETASAALMFGDRTVLFAHRSGMVIEDFGCGLPHLAVVGFATSGFGAGGFGHTERPVPPRPVHYSSAEIDRFQRLRDMLRAALADGDPNLLGAVATASTAINQRYHPVAAVDTVLPLVERCGAVGLQVAHGGGVAGLIFDGAAADLAGRQHQARTLLAGVSITDTWRLTVGG